ncbi:hypothetical protein [Nocardia brasiliensis]
MLSYIAIERAEDYLDTGGELRAIKYAAERVTFVLGDALVVLTISDARDLLEALPHVLTQSDYAEYLTDESRAVA